MELTIRTLSLSIIFCIIMAYALPAFAANPISKKVKSRNIQIYWAKFEIPAEFQKQPLPNSIFYVSENAGLIFENGEIITDKYKIKTILKNRKLFREEALAVLIEDEKNINKTYKYISHEYFDVNDFLVVKLKGHVRPKDEEPFIQFNYMIFHIKADSINSIKLSTLSLEKEKKYEPVFDKIVRSIKTAK